MTAYLLDCNHLSVAIRKVSRLRDRLWQERRAGHRLGTCLPALCELEVGMVQTHNPAEYFRRLREIMSIVRVWPLDSGVTGIYAETYLQAKQMGKAISQVDLILASMAKLQGMTLLTSDRDFEPFSQLSIENWAT